MIIKNIKIKNFRNITFTDIKPGSKINFILGKNAQGKTSLVEAIYTAALLKSFRTNSIEDTINVNKNIAEIEIKINKDNIEHILNINYGKKYRNVHINGKNPDNNQFFSYLNTIIFYPEEVNYLSNYPFHRRNLLDRAIFYNNYKYIHIYKNYTRCLKQRNLYLKNNHNDFDCWKEILIKYGSEIIRERLNYLKKINKFFSNEIFNGIHEEKYSINYSKYYENNDEIENYLSDEFKSKKNKEISLGYTLVGPHRDDIKFLINDKPSEKYASQGQKRSFIISFKTAQIYIYKKKYGFYPILILDDMNSELDSDRKNRLLENIFENSGQVFITSTDVKNIGTATGNKIFKVENGVICSAEWEQEELYGGR